MMRGYTPKKAERLKFKADATVAKIEDLTEQLRHLIPDVDIDRFTSNVGHLHILEEYRQIAAGLHETIDRRTQR